MTTNREFCRFNRGRSTTSGTVDESPMSLKEIPPGGLCLSAFLIVRDLSERVLMGKIDPEAPWDHLGALDPRRIELHSKGWMLPSSHLIVHESPQDAARRIAEEQLELPELIISEPKVVSEVYPPRYFPDLADHWDLEFLFFSSCPADKIPKKSRAFKELSLIDPKTSKRSQIARSHGDVLSHAGIDLVS
jgi:hypothetical protein